MLPETLSLFARILFFGAELEPFCHDLGAVSLLSALLIVPGSRLYAPFHIRHVSFFEVFAGYLSQSSPQNDAVKLRLLLFLSSLVFPRSVRGHEIGRASCRERV